MLERAEELKQRIRETPLDERLDNAKRRIGRMCSEGRPPRMTIPVQYDDDDFYISTTLSDAQATIADLQGQVVAWHKRLQEADEAYYAVGELNDALQQRVAQLESMLAEEHPGLDEVCDKLTTLQADHATLLGLVMKLPVVPTNVLPNYMKDMRQYDKHDYSAFSALLEYRASLPAQPAQGG